MPSESKFTTDSQGNVAVRVVNQVEALPASDPNWMFARDTNGNIAVRVVGADGGGSDQHNLGYYATQSALETAHPTASAGDFAIVGETDTFWVWDTDTNAWVNTGNAQGTTYLTFPNTWTTNSTTKALCDDIAADNTSEKGKAYLGEVTCSDLPAGMLNGEVIVEIMDGTTAANKVIVLTLTSGNVAPYMWKYTYWNGGSNVSGWIGFQNETNIDTVATSTLTQQCADNTIYNCGELSALTITFPATPGVGYISQVNFTSGATATTLSAPVGTIWRGSDVDSNGFTPVANKRYCVLFFYDGTAMRGLVQGA